MENKTIYGYPIEDLIIFAQICRRNGVTEEQLRDYKLTFETAFKMLKEELEEKIWQRYGWQQ